MAIRFYRATRLALVLGIGACSSDDGTNKIEGGNDPGAGPEGDGIVLGGNGSAGAGATSGAGAGPNLPPLGPDGIPVGFTGADIGAWQLGDPFTSDAQGSSTQDQCESILLGVVRDFKDGSESGGHPDFETYTGDGLQGIVENRLGDDEKPVYAHSGSTIYTTSPDDFDQWYRNVDGVNQAFLLHLFLEDSGGGTFTFESNEFFPLDGAGWGDQGHSHNYHFTTEVHTRFEYRGGERFRFKGDDDLWVFINGRLAIDLGGLHPIQEDEIDLDSEAGQLGIEVGNVYPLDLFHAERHTQHSNFRIDTNLTFVDCGRLVPEVVR